MMKVPNRIEKLIRDIENEESKLKHMWKELYDYLDEYDIDCQDDIVSNLQDGVGADNLIEYLKSL